MKSKTEHKAIDYDSITPETLREMVKEPRAKAVRNETNKVLRLMVRFARRGRYCCEYETYRNLAIDVKYILQNRGFNVRIFDDKYKNRLEISWSNSPDDFED